MQIQNHLHLDNQIPDNILSLFTYLPCVLYRCINLLHQIQINVLGPCICSREFVRQLKERGVDDGHIILVNRLVHCPQHWLPAMSKSLQILKSTLLDDWVSGISVSGRFRAGKGGANAPPFGG